MLQKLFHVNICVRDMERSISFYQGLGFNKVNDLGIFPQLTPTDYPAQNMGGVTGRIPLRRTASTHH